MKGFSYNKDGRSVTVTAQRHLVSTSWLKKWLSDHGNQAEFKGLVTSMDLWRFVEGVKGKT